MLKSQYRSCSHITVTITSRLILMKQVTSSNGIMSIYVMATWHPSPNMQTHRHSHNLLNNYLHRVSKK